MRLKRAKIQASKQMQLNWNLNYPPSEKQDLCNKQQILKQLDHMVAQDILWVCHSKSISRAIAINDIIGHVSSYMESSGNLWFNINLLTYWDSRLEVPMEKILDTKSPKLLELALEDWKIPAKYESDDDSYSIVCLYLDADPRAHKKLYDRIETRRKFVGIL